VDVTRVLITGATGVVGSALVPRFLERADGTLVLLIRARSPEHLQERFGRLLDFWRADFFDPGVLDRIEAVRGDVTLPRLGLEPEIYRKYTERLTHIVHSAADVRMNRPLEEARAIAVGSAREILAFAEHCRRGGDFKKLEFVSTIGVGGDLEGAVEERLITEVRGFRNSYEAAKAEAEELVFRAIDGGLPATVHRPSMVVGNSRTGKIIAFQVFYYLCELLSGRRTRGFVPRIRGVRLDTVPADFVADAIAWSCDSEDTVGGILHLCSGPQGSIEVSELTDRVREAMSELGISLPPLRRIPFRLLIAAANLLRPAMSDNQRRGLKHLPMFLQYREGRQYFENTRTTALLSDAGIDLPRIQDYLKPVLRYAHGHRSQEKA
jgi:thioester reductase-like protein